MMGLLDAIKRNGDGPSEAALREELQTMQWQAQHLEENMRDLELQIVGDEVGWRRLSTQLQRDFSRDGLDRIMDLSRAMYLSNPLIQRAVNVRAYYVWAQGVTFTAADEKIQAEIVEPMIEDPFNRLELYGHQAMMLTDLDQQIDGNLFLALFTDDEAEVQVRSVPAEEIREIITDPDDERHVWYYRRVWQQRTLNQDTGTIDVAPKEALYPDVNYSPAQQKESIGGTEVRWDSPIIHQRVGGLKHMAFGVPETYAAIDWARAYREFLQDWHTIVSSLARFAWRATTKKSKVETLKSKLGAGKTSGDELEEGAPPRRPPIPGSVFIGGDEDQFTPINKSGATTSADDARPSRMMVGSAMDLPDTMLSGDTSGAHLATAKSLDRPTELAMVSRQRMWAEFHTRIVAYKISAKIVKGRLSGRKERVNDMWVTDTGETDSSIDVDFPPILEHDVTETVGALVSAATLDGKADAGTIPREELSKLLMNAVGVEDVQAQLDSLDTQDAQAVAQAVETLTKLIEAQS